VQELGLSVCAMREKESDVHPPCCKCQVGYDEQGTSRARYKLIHFRKIYQNDTLSDTLKFPNPQKNRSVLRACGQEREDQEATRQRTSQQNHKTTRHNSHEQIGQEHEDER